MMSSQIYPLATFGLGVMELLIIFVAIPVFLGVPIAIIAIIFARKRRSEELWHETVRIALEKGQPLPPQLIQQAPSSSNDLRNGLILIGTGAALSLFLGVLGAIPAFIGIALLLNWVFESRSGSRAPAPENRTPPPQA